MVLPPSCQQIFVFFAGWVYCSAKPAVLFMKPLCLGSTSTFPFYTPGFLNKSLLFYDCPYLSMEGHTPFPFYICFRLVGFINYFACNLRKSNMVCWKILKQHGGFPLENHWTDGLSNGQVWRGMDMFFCIFFSGQPVEGFEMIRVKESDKKLRDVLMLVMNWWVMI